MQPIELDNVCILKIAKHTGCRRPIKVQQMWILFLCRFFSIDFRGLIRSVERKWYSNQASGNLFLPTKLVDPVNSCIFKGDYFVFHWTTNRLKLYQNTTKRGMFSLTTQRCASTKTIKMNGDRDFMANLWPSVVVIGLPIANNHFIAVHFGVL